MRNATQPTQSRNNLRNKHLQIMVARRKFLWQLKIEKNLIVDFFLSESVEVSHTVLTFITTKLRGN